MLCNPELLATFWRLHRWRLASTYPGRTQVILAPSGCMVTVLLYYQHPEYAAEFMRRNELRW